MADDGGDDDDDDDSIVLPSTERKCIKNNYNITNLRFNLHEKSNEENKWSNATNLLHSSPDKISRRILALTL